MFSERRNEAIGKSGGVKRGPKPVARTREVMAYSGGIKSGIDAAEKNPPTRRDYVPDSFAFGGE